VDLEQPAKDDLEVRQLVVKCVLLALKPPHIGGSVYLKGRGGHALFVRSELPGTVLRRTLVAASRQCLRVSGSAHTRRVAYGGLRRGYADQTWQCGPRTTRPDVGRSLVPSAAYPLDWRGLDRPGWAHRRARGSAPRTLASRVGSSPHSSSRPWRGGDRIRRSGRGKRWRFERGPVVAKDRRASVGLCEAGRLVLRGEQLGRPSATWPLEVIPGDGWMDTDGTDLIRVDVASAPRALQSRPIGDGHSRRHGRGAESRRSERGPVVHLERADRVRAEKTAEFDQYDDDASAGLR
jgi:hypothetical protein